MRLMAKPPTVTELEQFIAGIPHFPLCAKDAVKLARKQRADISIVELLLTFRDDEYFLNKEDLLTRAEQVRFLNIEEQKEERVQFLQGQFTPRKKSLI